MSVRITAVRTNDVPAEWETALRVISPKSAAHSYLDFKWEHVLGRVKGRWQDRSRWVLYECQPAWAIPTGLRLMLDDAPPRLLPPARAYARRQFVDDWAHEFYRVHRVFARPFLVLQGRNGGTPAGYSMREQEVLRALGEPTDPPPVGTLPYAPFDWRVIQQILTRDHLLKAGMKIDTIADARLIGSELREEEREAEAAFRREFVSWFKGTLAPGADFLTWYTRRSEADRVLRTASRAEMAAAREFESLYLDTGAMPAMPISVAQ